MVLRLQSGKSLVFWTEFSLFLAYLSYRWCNDEYIVGWKLPLGIIGAIILGIVGAWLMTDVIQIGGIGDITCGVFLLFEQQ